MLGGVTGCQQRIDVELEEPQRQVLRTCLEEVELAKPQGANAIDEAIAESCISLLPHPSCRASWGTKQGASWHACLQQSCPGLKGDTPLLCLPQRQELFRPASLLEASEFFTAVLLHSHQLPPVSTQQWKEMAHDTAAGGVGGEGMRFWYNFGALSGDQRLVMGVGVVFAASATGAFSPK